MSANLDEVLATMRQRFSSMNAVPVTRAHITHDEFSAMEEELAKLRSDLEKARAEVAFLDGDLLYWVGRAVSKGNANSDTEEAWERYEQWLRDR